MGRRGGRVGGSSSSSESSSSDSSSEASNPSSIGHVITQMIHGDQFSKIQKSEKWKTTFLEEHWGSSHDDFLEVLDAMKHNSINVSEALKLLQEL